MICTEVAKHKPDLEKHVKHGIHKSHMYITMPTQPMAQMETTVTAEIQVENKNLYGVIQTIQILHGNCVFLLVMLIQIHVITKTKTLKEIKMQHTEAVKQQLDLGNHVYHGTQIHLEQVMTKVKRMELMETTAIVEILMEKKKQYGVTRVIQRIQQKKCVILSVILKIKMI